MFHIRMRLIRDGKPQIEIESNGNREQTKSPLDRWIIVSRMFQSAPYKLTAHFWRRPQWIPMRKREIADRYEIASGSLSFFGVHEAMHDGKSAIGNRLKIH